MAKKDKSKDKKVESKVPTSGPEFMRMTLERGRTKLLKIVDEETLNKIAPILRETAFAAEEFDGRRHVVGYKRAAKHLFLGEDAEKLSKGRE